MDITESRLVTPNQFIFPFVPYDIQKDFMRNLYEAIEEKKLGIFESPTGTGKSMSLICGSLKWLFDAQQRLKKDITEQIEKLDCELKKPISEENWLEEYELRVESREKRDSLRENLRKIEAVQSRNDKARKRSFKMKERAQQLNKPKSCAIDFATTSGSNNNLQEEEDYIDLLLADDPNIDEAFDSSTLDDENSNASEPETGGQKNYFGIKVFLCSRTHSQLSQLLKEIQKSPYKDFGVRVVSLASRQNYCINESVSRLKHLSLISDKCQELRSNNKSTKTSALGGSLKSWFPNSYCPYYQETNIENVKTKILTEIADIEELVSWGKRLNGCPYYASRHAIDEAQIILVPYNIILHKSTRLAYGINLKNSVVIIDEAHNLLDAIGNIHSCQVTGLQLIQSYHQLVGYRDKYTDSFSPRNLLNLNQIIFILKRLLQKLGATSGDFDSNVSPQKEPGVLIETLADFLLSCEIFTINIHDLLEFINSHKLVNKLQGFPCQASSSVVIHNKTEKTGVSAFENITAKKEENHEGEKEETDNISGNPILSVVSFFEILTNHCLDGRVIAKINRTVGTSSLKYLLLNPARHFSDIVLEARSVILAGGTMQPFSEFTDQLFYFAGGTPDRITVFTCGHIIPENNILPIVVSSGPTGKNFNFSNLTRNCRDLQQELGRLLSNVCDLVPAGIVCFFPSYEYENVVYEYLEKTKIIEKLSTKKKIFREPKMSSKVDKVLKGYSAAARSQGALLFSVVGGKLSEGLNFSDDLGRCIIVVGLPYPNLASVELKEKMNYLNTILGPTAGKEYYDGLCMKAVNQSIGRSIRHKNDYASVLLVDERYNRLKCEKALPDWIQKSLIKEESYRTIMRHLANFFVPKKKQK